MANEDFTTEENINIAQMRRAFEHIAHLACSIQGVSDAITQHGDKQGDLIIAVENLAAKIGWIADRCSGVNVRSTNDWLMPYSWDEVGKETES